MGQTIVIVFVLVVIWTWLGSIVNKKKPGAANKETSKLVSIILSTLIVMFTIIYLTEDIILTEVGKRMFNIIAPVTLISCTIILIIHPIVELYKMSNKPTK